MSGACLLAILYLSFWLSRACVRMVLCKCSISRMAGPPCFCPSQRNKLAIPVYLKCSENHWYKAMWSVGLSCHRAIFCISRYWAIAVLLGCSKTRHRWEGSVRTTCWPRLVWCFRFSHNVLLAIINKHKASSMAKLLLLLLKSLGKIQAMRQAQMSVTACQRFKSLLSWARIMLKRVSTASDSKRTNSSCSSLFMCPHLASSFSALLASSHVLAQCQRISVAEKGSLSRSFSVLCFSSIMTIQKQRHKNWKIGIGEWQQSRIWKYGYMGAQPIRGIGWQWRKAQETVATQAV